MANTVRIAVEKTGGSIFEAEYLETLRRINDEVFLIPDVERPYMKSLWMPSVRWVAVTEEGLEGGPVIPDTCDGSARSLDQVRANVECSGEVGQLVAANYHSTVFLLPLLGRDPATVHRGWNGQHRRGDSSAPQYAAGQQIIKRVGRHGTG